MTPLTLLSIMLPIYNILCWNSAKFKKYRQVNRDRLQKKHKSADSFSTQQNYSYYEKNYDAKYFCTLNSRQEAAVNVFTMRIIKGHHPWAMKKVKIRAVHHWTHQCIGLWSVDIARLYIPPHSDQSLLQSTSSIKICWLVPRQFYE